MPEHVNIREEINSAQAAAIAPASEAYRSGLSGADPLDVNDDASGTIPFLPVGGRQRISIQPRFAAAGQNATLALVLFATNKAGAKFFLSKEEMVFTSTGITDGTNFLADVMDRPGRGGMIFQVRVVSIAGEIADLRAWSH